MPLAREVVDLVNDSEVIVVGSGLFGLTIAERVANQTQKSVAIIEKREVIGGNAYSYFDEGTGIEIHKYGSHLFHTSNKRVWDYVNTFTSFTDYRHRVFTKHNDVIYSMPINLHTLSQFFDLDLNPTSARKILDEGKSRELSSSSFEHKAISQVGTSVYEAFFKNYTLKQWQLDPRELPGEIFGRLPIRFNLNSDYFDDTYQGLPVNGYAPWFSKMVESPRISTLLNTDFFQLRQDLDFSAKLIIYTGPIDRFFDYRHGELAWRTLDFDFEKVAVSDYQGTSVMNYADITPTYTRIHEFKHLHPERKYAIDETIIAREYSRRATRLDEPYYPVNSSADREMLLKYRGEIANERNVYFGGRLGTYQYLDMHMAIASALTLFDNEIFPKLESAKL